MSDKRVQRQDRFHHFDKLNIRVEKIQVGWGKKSENCKQVHIILYLNLRVSTSKLLSKPIFYQIP